MGIKNKDYCGTIVLEIDGQEYDVVSVTPNVKTGNKTVQTMNSKRRALGSSCGVIEIALKIEAAIPLDKSEPDWIKMRNATMTIYPACGVGGKREIYTGCTTEEVGSAYTVGKEAVRSISLHALDLQVV
ncbi:hypothetical protein [Herminiimonas arsenitoxidans]|uniref:hypothetical protein n=1 Tax=Herminiimonas arsenitoxidans TaxID=1809410 RepID=UPI0009714C6F|nr:hypothetical protein [Herminiimonas arsenitoxidans]